MLVLLVVEEPEDDSLTPELLLEEADVADAMQVLTVVKAV